MTVRHGHPADPTEWAVKGISLDRFEAELESWERTPYRDCDMRKGSGVDCLRFVVAVSDFIHGFDTSRLPTPPKLPRQTSLHAPTLAWRVVRWLQRRYPNEVVWDIENDEGTVPEVLPGDVLCVKNQVHPGHALIAGAKKNVIWHSMNSPGMDFGGHVHRTNLHWVMSNGLIRLWRPTETLLCLE